MQAGNRAAHGHVHVNAFALDQLKQLALVISRARLGQRVKTVNCPRKSVPNQPVGMAFNQHNPVPRFVKQARQLQCLGHFSAADQHGFGMGEHRRHKPNLKPAPDAVVPNGHSNYSRIDR